MCDGAVILEHSAACGGIVWALWVVVGLVSWTVVAGLLAVHMGKSIRLADVRDRCTDEDAVWTLAGLLSASDGAASGLQALTVAISRRE
jgi:hypothetical protein